MFIEGSLSDKTLDGPLGPYGVASAMLVANPMTFLP